MFEECKVEGDFTLSSGRQSEVFYDFDLLTPASVVGYVTKLINKIPEILLDDVHFVVSPAVGGIVPGFLLAFALNKPFVIVDKQGSLRGKSIKGGSYLVVDDVISSFQAANTTTSIFTDEKCLGIAAYVFRGREEDLTRQDYPVFYLDKKEQEV